MQANTDLGVAAAVHPRQLVWRGTASGGGLYPVSVYWVSGPSGPLTPGLYHYSPPQHAMQRLLAGDVSGQVREALGTPDGDLATDTDQFLVLGREVLAERVQVQQLQLPRRDDGHRRAGGDVADVGRGPRAARGAAAVVRRGEARLAAGRHHPGGGRLRRRPAALGGRHRPAGPRGRPAGRATGTGSGPGSSSTSRRWTACRRPRWPAAPSGRPPTRWSRSRCAVPSRAASGWRSRRRPCSTATCGRPCGCAAAASADSTAGVPLDGGRLHAVLRGGLLRRRLRDRR